MDDLYAKSPGKIEPKPPRDLPTDFKPPVPQQIEVPEMPTLDQQGSKPALKSKTVDASLIGLAAVIAAAGLNLLGAETTPNEVETAALSGVAAVSFVVAIVGRIRAKKEIKGVV